MRLIIDIPEEIKAVIDKNGTNEIVAETLWQAVKNGTPIPDNATNGEILKTMFGTEEVDMSNTYCVYFPEEDYSHYFFKGWWNAPYQKGGKE